MNQEIPQNQTIPQNQMGPQSQPMQAEQVNAPQQVVAQTPPVSQQTMAQGGRPGNQQESSNSFSRFINFFKNNFVWILIIFLLILVAAGVKAIFFKPAVISVIGTGRSSAKPVQVEMLVSQVDTDQDPVLAIVASEESVSRITAKAKELAGEDAKIQKSFYQVTPSAATGQLTYQVVNVFKITANDPFVTSDLIKGLYSVGATNVSGVNFIPENKSAVTQEVRAAAIKDAKEKAKSIAKASGKRVGRIISVSDDLTEGNSNISTDNSGESGVNSANQVNYIKGVPSEIDISKSMTVTYQIW